MIFKNDNHKVLFLGIISTLLVIYFIQPFINFIGKKVFEISSVLFKSYNIVLYHRIAIRDYNLEKYSYVFVLLILILVIAIIYYFSVYIVKKSQVELDGSMKIYLETIKEKTELDDSTNESINKKNELLEQYQKSTISSNKTLSESKRVFIISIFMFSVFGLINYSTELNIKNKINYYENTLRIISPYITENMVKVFESKFVSIRNEEDYNSLKNEMNEIVKTNELKTIWK
jgi:hypothetical protein